MIFRLATEADISAIILLRNMYGVESSGKSQRRGFLTTPLTREYLLRRIETGVILAIDNSKVDGDFATLDGVIAGYDILVSMRDTEILYSALAHWYKEKVSAECYESSVLSRQYCVHADYRGGRVVRGIFAFQARHLISSGHVYTFGEISPENQISLVAAQRLLRYSHLGDRDGWWIGFRDERCV